MAADREIRLSSTRTSLTGSSDQMLRSHHQDRIGHTPIKSSRYMYLCSTRNSSIGSNRGAELTEDLHTLGCCHSLVYVGGERVP